MVCLTLLAALIVQAPDLNALAKRGAGSAERLKTGGASWETNLLFANGVTLTVSVIKWKGQTRAAVSGVVGGQRKEAFSIVMNETAWYLREPQRKVKSRPYEAHFTFPNGYLLLAAAQPAFVDDPAATKDWTYQSSEGDVATFNVPLTAAERLKVEQALKQGESILNALPESKREWAEKGFGHLRRTLKMGRVVSVDLRSGLLVTRSTARLSVSFGGFQWRESVDETLFATDKVAWEDQTSALEGAEPSNLLMILHAPMWRPGRKDLEPEPELCLLDTQTRRMVRLPYRGAGAAPGCFSKDRTKVFVSGLDELAGNMGLFEVDLKTGANRRIAASLPLGMYMIPALSPDGGSLAFVQLLATDKPFESQVLVLDLVTDKVRPIGKPFDTGFISWAPDGKSLIIVRREWIDPDPNKPSVRTVARLDLDGTRKDLRAGDSPVLMPDNRILFKDGEVWKTCDLEGKNESLVGDGLRRHGFPTLSPDGKRVLFMRFAEGKGPEPVVIDLKTLESHVVAEADGFYAMPAWK
jgi:hypothetical protein